MPKSATIGFILNKGEQMKHIEITENGKVIWSADVNEISLSQNRSITALYKQGKYKPYLLAPSRIAQTVIYYEERIDKARSEFHTEEKVDFNLSYPWINSKL